MNEHFYPSNVLQSANTIYSRRPLLSYHLFAFGRNEGHHCNSGLDIPATHHMASMVDEAAAGLTLHACTFDDKHTHTNNKHAPQGILDGSTKNIFTNQIRIHFRINHSIVVHIVYSPCMKAVATSAFQHTAL